MPAGWSFWYITQTVFPVAKVGFEFAADGGDPDEVEAGDLGAIWRLEHLGIILIVIHEGDRQLEFESFW
jgi:hypothetical protein